MQFKKEWVIPTAVGVSAFGFGSAVGFGIALRKVVKGSEKINEYLSLVERQLDAAEIRVVHFDEIGQRLDRLIEGYERLYESHRRFDGTEQESNESEQSFDGGEQETSGQLDIFADSGELLEPIESSTASTTGVGFSKQNELKKQALMSDEEDEEDEEMVRVIRRDVDENWDWDVEMEKRKHSSIYIIHRDEFEDEEKAEEGFTQSTLTYYEGDGILCDEHDVPLYEKESFVGELEFGKGSGDPNVCYVRNERLTSEYEIVLEEGWFGKEVLGQHVQDLIEKSKNAKIEHSVPKFRPE